jgi:Methylase involved in ubiquinone/menaquinone biosynthesis
MTNSSTSAHADAYELQMGRWSRRLAEPFLDFVGTSDGERVLDVGCGTGSLTFAVARRSAVKAVCGVDKTVPFIDQAIRNNRDPRIEFRVGDACALSFPNGTFDRVLALLVLHHVADAKLAVQEMRRVGRRGATIAAAVWDARGGFVSQRLFFDTAAMLDPKIGEIRAQQFTRPMSRPGELEATWHSEGLCDVRHTTISIRMDFASFDDYWTPFLGRQAIVASCLAKLSKAQLVELRESVRLAYLDGEPDGPRSYAAIAWAVAGTVPS